MTRVRKTADHSHAPEGIGQNSGGLPGPEPVRVLRIIARMNLGGPAYNVTYLSSGLAAYGFETLLVAGSVGPGEKSSVDLARESGVRLTKLAALGPAVDPRKDLKALLALIRLMRKYRPAIVHTHTAKAGVLGRAAALLTLRPRPVLVHTYHGHVLEGYFGRPLSVAFRLAERLLAVWTDCLVGVSHQTVEDLARLGVADRGKFRVIPIGLDLASLLSATERDRNRGRRMLDVGADEVLAISVGRLVPIKRLDRLLRAFAVAQSRERRLRLAIVGDGPLRNDLEEQARSLGLDGAVSFLGYRRDLLEITSAADFAVLTSDNEGTPVALIEAAAAGRPAVATAVGGVSEVVGPSSGILCTPKDETGLASAMLRLAHDVELRADMGAKARQLVAERYDAQRLIRETCELYRMLLDRKRH